MRNNLNERFENLRQQTASSEVPAQVATGQENGLSFVVPIEMVDLPSCGKYYPEGHPLKGKTTIEIRQMTAKEEDILTNKTFLKNGVIIDKLLESIIVDKSIDVSTLLIGDKNAIMIAARATAYGPAYDLNVACVECGLRQNQSVDLQQIETLTAEDALEKVKQDESVILGEMDFDSVGIKLPKTGWVVECRFLTGEDELNMVKFIEAKKSRKQGDDLSISEQLALIIASINTVQDPAQIVEAIKYMPATDAKYLRTTYQKLVPNVKIMCRFRCEACSSQQDLEVPFTQEFFWPK